MEFCQDLLGYLLEDPNVIGLEILIVFRDGNPVHIGIGGHAVHDLAPSFHFAEASYEDADFFLGIEAVFLSQFRLVSGAEQFGI